MLRKCIKDARKFARTHKIKDRATNIIIWTPIMVAVYINVATLTYAYYRSDSIRPNSIHK